MVGSLRAGASLLSAFESALRGVRSPLRPYFQEVAGRIRLGDDPRAAVSELPAHVPLETFRLFATSLSVHWEVGGSLATTLGTVGRTVRDRIELSRRVRAQGVEAHASVAVVLRSWRMCWAFSCGGRIQNGCRRSSTGLGTRHRRHGGDLCRRSAWCGCRRLNRQPTSETLQMAEFIALIVVAMATALVYVPLCRLASAPPRAYPPLRIDAPAASLAASGHGPLRCPMARTCRISPAAGARRCS